MTHAGPDALDFLFERFATAPARVAFIDRGAASSYGELLETTAAFTGRLVREGINAGDVIAVRGDYSPRIICLLLALARAGAIVVPVTGEAVVEWDTVLALARPRWVIDFRVAEPTFTRTDLIADNALLDRVRTPGNPGLILFSSGSSGSPKAILHDLRLVAARFHKATPRYTAIAFLMLDHFGGINTVLSILSGLGTIVTVKDRSVVSICRAVDEHGVEVLPTTPSFLNLLVRSDALERFDLGSLKRITYGTEVMPQQTLDRVRAAFPGVLLQQTYGLSELGVLRSRSREDGSLWVSVGGEGFQTKVVDGILWIKSDYAMVGYLNAPDPFDPEGWFNTQDLVEVDGDWLRILGRDSDLINVGGQKVYPAEVEQAILELDNVREVAVFGEPNPLLGQIVVAKVATLQPESAAELKVRIRRALAPQLAAFMLPTKVVVAMDDDMFYSARLKKRRQA